MIINLYNDRKKEVKVVAWHILAVFGIIFIILEMLVPSVFFLNFAVGAFVSAICSLYITSWTALIIISVLVSLLSLLILRPLLVKKADKSQETGISGKYIGKIAKVVETVTKDSGVISIYDERWQARSEEEIPVDANVEIVKNESLVMFVKEVK